MNKQQDNQCQVITFKERVKQNAISNANLFKENFVDCEYCIISKAFEAGYTIIKAFEGNYLHLIGVNASMPADSFFKKCFDGRLNENDFDFKKQGVSSKALKGAVREKIKVFPNMISFFDGKTLLVQKDFKKNKIECAFASTDNTCTLGFSDSGHPKTLLKGNHLNSEKSFSVDVIIKKKVNEGKFKDIVYNDSTADLSYLDGSIVSIISDDIMSLMGTIIKNKGNNESQE